MIHSMVTSMTPLNEEKMSGCVSPLGAEGALFQHSVEVPVLRSELFKDLT